MPADDPEAVERVVARIRAVYGSWGRTTPIATMRLDWDALFDRPLPEGVREEAVSAGGVPAAWITAAGGDRTRAILYCHGGGFRLGSIRSHRDLTARLADASGCAVLGLDYRLAPEHLFPAPVEDALAAYAWLLAECGGESRRIAVAGDSAGGGLALSLMLALRDAGSPLPAAGWLLSPWTDLAATGGSYATRAEHDPIHQRGMILATAKGYLGPTGDPLAPLASPLYGDLSGLPPLLIQVGDRETVLDDSRVFAERARAAGTEAELQVWDGMIHVFPMFADDVPEAARAIAQAGAFLRERMG